MQVARVVFKDVLRIAKGVSGYPRVTQHQVWARRHLASLRFVEPAEHAEIALACVGYACQTRAASAPIFDWAPALLRAVRAAS